MLLIILLALAIVLNLFPDIQNSSLIVAVGLLSGTIELIGFLRERNSKEIGSQTNIAGDVHGSVLPGKYDGPVAVGAGAEATDFRGSKGIIYKPIGPVEQHIGDNITIYQQDKHPTPSQIPAPPEDFTGRKEDIDALLKDFKKGATITGLRGMGGIGKTALALVLADRLKASFAHGQIFINLLGTSKNPLAAGDAMAHVIRSFLGVDYRLPDDPGELAGLYQSVLSGKRALILLDNAASREQVEPLLPPSGSAVIVTSRNRFALPGLIEKDLDVLPLGDAEKLLLEIAERIGGRADELARLCGCLPIALRNAAYALKERKDLGVAEYLQRLQEAKNRVDLVEASFNLSYDLLMPQMQKLWSRLSVFPADFDRTGAAAVWETDLNLAASALSDLVKLSLVEYDPAGDRYHLHDLARDFAASRLKDKERARAEQRQAEHYRDVLSASDDQYMKGGEDLIAGLELFDSEWANIQAGWSWAVRNMQHSSAAARLCSSYPDAGAYVLYLRLHPRDMIRWLENALEAARQLKDKAMEGVHLGNLGNAYADLGDARKAIEFYEQRLVIAREIEDRRGEGKALGNLGAAYYDLGDARKAIEFYEQALRITKEIGDRRNEGAWLGNLGISYKNLGDARKAIEFYEQHLVIAREIGDRRGEGNTLWNKSLALVSLGRRAEAVKLAEEALRIYEQIEDPNAEKVRQQLMEWRR